MNAEMMNLCINVVLIFFLNNLLKQGSVSMSFFRSQPIDHYKLILPRENAWQIMNMLGTDHTKIG
jgi:hypothetical protein